MPPSFYQIRQCENPDCGLRYPLTAGHPFGERCPLCLGPTRVELQKTLNPDAKFSPSLPIHAHPVDGRQVEGLLDNVRSAWNVGAIFRNADALGVHRLHLCGITPTPENSSVAKTALGADRSVAWTASKNALATAKELHSQGAALVALEQDARAVPISDFVIDDFRSSIIIVGNEITGVDPALLELCDKIVYIPMRGQKRSLNVEVAFGVAINQLLR